LLRRDREGDRFRFAPLQGATFRGRVPPGAREGLPDSVVLLTTDGGLLVKSAAVLRVLKSLGGAWGGLARALACLPRGWLDALYDGVARARRRFFREPVGLCPRVPAGWEGRFLE
jgi:predicted DCC family thiol-disulfide oxidoreductase YuxK